MSSIDFPTDSNRPMSAGSHHTTQFINAPTQADGTTSTPDTTGPGSAGPASAGPASAGPESAGPESAGPESADAQRVIAGSDLTQRQWQILSAITDFMDEHGFAPSFREIGVRVGLKSTSSVKHQLEILEDKGYLKTSRNKGRAMEILIRPQTTVRTASAVPSVQADHSMGVTMQGVHSPVSPTSLAFNAHQNGSATHTSAIAVEAQGVSRRHNAARQPAHRLTLRRTAFRSDLSIPFARPIRSFRQFGGCTACRAYRRWNPHHRRTACGRCDAPA